MDCKCLSKHADSFYAVFRILVGLLFFFHGAQKLFGWFGGNQVGTIASTMGVAGIIEFVGGLMVLVGFYSWAAGIVNALLMLAAYFMAHAGNGWNPLVNKGELAVLYFAAFLVILSKGSGKWSVDEAMK
jgi:putative oxidoreductase